MAQGSATPMDTTIGQPKGLLAVGCGYLILCLLSLHFFIEPENLSAFWLPNGWLAVALILGRSSFLKVAAVGFVANVVGNVLSGTPLNLALGFGGVNTAEGGLIALCFLKWGGSVDLMNLRSLLVLLLSCALGTLLGALLGATFLGLHFGWTHWMATLQVWYAADFLGNVLVMSLLMAMLSAKDDPQTHQRWSEVAVYGIAMALICGFLFYGSQGISTNSYTYLIFPILMVSALRLSMLKVVSLVAMLALFAAFHTISGTGVFATGGRGLKDSMLWLQIYLMVSLFSVLLCAVFMREFLMRERKLDALKNKYQGMMEVIGSGIIVVGESGDIVEANRGAEKMFGYDAGELLGKQVEVLLKDEQRSQHIQDRLKYLKHPHSRRMGARADLQAVKREGEVIHVDVGLSPLITADRTDVVANVVDVSHRVNIENELQLALVKANESSKAKMQFLANMSHEIRTPLNGIITSMTILKDAMEGQDSLEIVKVMERSSQNLLNIVNDILDLSKIEAGKLRFEKISYNMRELLDDSLRLYSPQCRAKGVDLKLDMESSFPNMLEGDPTRVKQVVNNLLSNAIKFTDEGSVALILRHQPLKKGEVKVIIKVRDTGIGMNAQQLERIFLSFEQADGSITRKYGGTGLGTTLVKKIVEAMGGRVEVESQEVGGTTFTVDFDAAIGGGERVKVSKGIKRNYNKKVLIAEDNETNAYLISLILKKYGVKSKVYCHGQDLLDHLDQEHDALITDIQMPVMDGLSLKEHLNAMAYDKPVCAMTANVFETDMEKYRELGFDKVLGKPFDVLEVVSALDEIFKQTS